MKWEETIFDKVLRLNRGFDLPNQDIEYGPYPIVASTSIKAFHKTYKVKGPGVTTGRSGSLGVVQYLTGRFWPLNTSLYVKDFKGNHERFIAYFLQTMRLENFNSGTGVPTLNQNHLHKLTVRIPPVPTQRKIAAILTAYDDLIETNKRRIALLEKMAEELYREWFVRMRFPGHQNTKFVKGVPEGWEPKRIGDLIEHYIGGGWGEKNPTTEFSESAFVIRGTDIPKVQTGIMSSIPFRFHTPSNLKSRVMQADDFVFEVSGGSKDQMLGRNIRVSSILLDSLPEPVIPASFCKLIRFKRQKVSPYLMQQYLKLFYDQGLVGIFQVQSTGISNYQFESFLKYHKMLTPADPLQEQFEEAVKPFLDLKDRLGLENSVVAQTRDLLLPRLISGKLSVEDLNIQFPPSMVESEPVEV